MAVINRANKKVRKEVIIPFEGEHNFIVPQYVNAAGKLPVLQDEPLVPQAPSGGTYTPSAAATPTPSISPNAGVTPAPPVLVPEVVNTPQPPAAPIVSGGYGRPIEPVNETPTQGTNTPTPIAYNASNYFPVKNYESMSCESITSYLTELNNVDTTGWDGINAARAQGDYNRVLTSVRNAKDTACRVVTPAPIIKEEDIVIFPDISSMDCAGLTAEIKRLQETSGLSATQKAQYDGQVINVQNKFTSKLCGISGGGITTTPTEVTSTTTITPQFSPVFGGGGGGGLGEEPQAEAPIEEETKKDNSWLWVLAIIGGLYFLTKKKN